MSENKSSVMRSTGQPSFSSSSSSSSSVRFVRSSASSLRVLSSLNKDEMIILFTPALPQSSSGTEDPFECLGRSISKYHARVRHVPFVPKVGLTDLHVAWIRKASAIVVVNCDPSFLADTKLSDSMSYQVKFSNDVLDTLYSAHGSANMPLSSVDVGISTPTRGADFQNMVLCSSYTKSNMEKAAGLLMG